MSEIRYEWTGMYRKAEAGEWYMEHHTLRPVLQHRQPDTTKRWILRRVETEEEK